MKSIQNLRFRLVIGPGLKTIPLNTKIKRVQRENLLIAVQLFFHDHQKWYLRHLLIYLLGVDFALKKIKKRC
jgi:hypothetical protein